MIHLRPATLGDATALLWWRNEPHTVALSRTGEVAWLDHLQWLTEKLFNPNCLLFIAQQREMPVGMIRLDFIDDAWHISIAVAPEHRCKGIGKAILKAIPPFPHSARLVANILAHNPASIRIFEANGFRLTGHNGPLLRYEIDI